MYKLEYFEKDKIEKFYENWEESGIYSFLSGYMGAAWVDDISSPNSARIITGDFCYLAGDAASPGAKELIYNIPEEIAEDVLLVPQNKRWSNLIEESYGENCEKIIRYATKKEGDVFDRALLKSYAESLPKHYSIVPIDEGLYHLALEDEWSHDFVSQFKDYKDFEQRGMGFGVIYKDKLVSGSSSYTVYPGGCEVETDTFRPYRRRGLAMAVTAHMILACLERGWYPSCDCANSISLHMAEKFGYRLDREYEVYAVF
ncbi:MAG: GNAT family N-acetyltransferase [Eubacteriaceae bacterium]|nr:GNAT family N-acetyltransferase [Eubacteriaceae bacterium]